MLKNENRRQKKRIKYRSEMKKVWQEKWLIQLNMKNVKEWKKHDDKQKKKKLVKE